MTGKMVMVTKPLHLDALHRLEQEVEVLTPFEASRDQILALLAEVHGVVLGGAFQMGSQALDRAPLLEVVGRHGVGLDNVDITAATERRIPVTYTPYGPTESTAEHALMLILATARRATQLDRAVRAGDWQIRDRLEVMGRELEGMVLGVVGFGRIGRRLAAMCRDALHMAVLVYDPYVDAERVAAWGAEPVADLVELAGRVDVLTVHAPLTAKTRGLVSREVIRALKPGAILVNTSRGPLVDEGALVEALADGNLGGAGIDVYDPQPPAPDHPLYRSELAVLTPHVASFTREGRRRMGMTVVEDVLRALRGEKPEFLVNPEIWENRRGA